MQDYKHTHSKIKSILSLGPRNPQDKRFYRNGLKIHKIIERCLKERRINLRAIDVCRQAKISVPTFYLHYRNTNHALYSYEKSLISNFTNSLPASHLGREAVFVILLNFIHKNQNYFDSTLSVHNTWLIYQLFDKIRPFIVSPNIKDKNYDVYIDNLISLISCWGKYENYAPEYIPLYTKKLLQMRVMLV